MILGFPLSFLFLYLAVRKVDISKTLQLLADTNYLYLIPASITFICDFSLRAFRWGYLLRPVKKCRFINLLSTTYIGFFANNILPMRAGEIIRFIMIGEKEQIFMFRSRMGKHVVEVFPGNQIRLYSAVGAAKQTVCFLQGGRGTALRALIRYA